MRRWMAWLLALTAAGLVSSGYLSAVKLFSGTCAFNESCPYFLGYPACFYGFAMYLIMFVVTLAGFFGKTKTATAIATNIWVAVVGAIFSGTFVIVELALSTCAYGLAFYIVILTVALFSRRALRRSESAAAGL